MKTSILLISSLLALGPAGAAFGAELTYPIVATGQTQCYDNRGVIAAPQPGQAFYGQDAQFQRHPASYTLSSDGLTVRDNVTGLTWQRSPKADGGGAPTSRDKLTLAGAQALPDRLNAMKFGGFDDWRLPTLKELYSLFQASGTDPGGGEGGAAGLKPFIDTNFFRFAYGEASAGERVIDSQYATSSLYSGPSTPGMGRLLFGVNFADGRIKGYGLQMPGGGEKTFFVMCVHGNPAYGKNDLRDNGDGTVTDRATGLMWSEADSGSGMNWQEALAWAAKQNAANYLGRHDWRLPSVKELQSIVDYSRSPGGSGSAAADPLFRCSGITNEAGQPDYPFYWSSTTHAGMRGGEAAMYVAFGRAAGWMQPPGMAGGGSGGRRGGPRGGGGGFHVLPEGALGQLDLTPAQQQQIGELDAETGARLAQILTPGQMAQLAQWQPPPRQGGAGFGQRPGGPGMGRGGQDGQAGGYQYVDVHGAGAQRSDPKSGDPSLFPHGRGPQGDVIRIYNYVRLVREAGM